MYIIRRWRAYSSHRKLWDESGIVTGLTDFHYDRDPPRLAAFLANFLKVYQDFLESGKESSLEKPFGKCTDILRCLIEFVNEFDPASIHQLAPPPNDPDADASGALVLLLPLF